MQKDEIKNEIKTMMDGLKDNEVEVLYNTFTKAMGVQTEKLSFFIETTVNNTTAVMKYALIETKKKLFTT